MAFGLEPAIPPFLNAALPQLSSSFTPSAPALCGLFEKSADGVLLGVKPLLDLAGRQLGLGKVPEGIRKALRKVPDKIDAKLDQWFEALAAPIRRAMGGGGTLFAGMVGQPEKFAYNQVNYQVFVVATKGAGGTWRAQVRVATDQAGQAPKLVVDLDAKQLAGKPNLAAVWGQVQALAGDVQKDLAAKNLSKAKTDAGLEKAKLVALADLLRVEGCAALNAGCFCAGTLVWTVDGYRPVEELAEGDLVLSRDEGDPDGPILARPVEAVFRRLGLVLGLGLEGGLVIRTTPEHPFFADGHGWTQAGCLRPGMRLLQANGAWLAVEGVVVTEEMEEVYNCRVAEFHTYFVGGEGCEVWAHNLSCDDFDQASPKLSKQEINSIVMRGNKILAELDAKRPNERVRFHVENELLLEQGKYFDNPKGLAGFLDSVAKELTLPAPKFGLFNALKEAATRAASRHRVALESAILPVPGKADVVDHEDKIAIQMKTVTSPDGDRVVHNLTDAAKQLFGKKTETPPANYGLLAWVKVPAGNQFGSTTTKPEAVAMLAEWGFTQSHSAFQGVPEAAKSGIVMRLEIAGLFLDLRYSDLEVGEQSP